MNSLGEGERPKFVKQMNSRIHDWLQSFLETEKAYIDKLASIIFTYKRPIEASVNPNSKIKPTLVFKKMDHSLPLILFSNVEQIKSLHSQFLRELYVFSKNPTVSTIPVGRFFFSMIPTLKIYTQYILNFSISNNELHELEKSSKVKEFLGVPSLTNFAPKIFSNIFPLKDSIFPVQIPTRNFSFRIANYASQQDFWT